MTVDDDNMPATDYEITGVTVSGTAKRVRLAVTPRIREGQSVTVSYADPGSDRVIQNANGVDAASFADEVVTNNSGVGPPKLESASVPVAGNLVELIFDRALADAAGRVPPPSAFTVTVDAYGMEATDLEITAVTVSGTDRRVQLAVTPRIKQYESDVTVSYRDSGPETAIQDVFGVDAASFADEDVLNYSEIGPLLLESARVPAAGNLVELIFFKEIDDAVETPPASAFTVTVDGEDVPVISVAISGPDKEVRLTVSPTIKQGQYVRVFYTDPDPDDDSAIRNLDGEDLRDFANIPVNESTVPNTKPPRAVSAMINPGDVSESFVTISRRVDFDNLPSADAFSFTYDHPIAGNNVDGVVGRVEGRRGSPSHLTGQQIVVTVGYFNTPSPTRVTLSYTDPTSEDDTKAIQSRSGVDAADFTIDVEIPERASNTQAEPLAAEFREMPATHDGSTAFSFELAFTEETRSGFSSATLRDSTLEVTGGAVTAVRRLEHGKNKEWAITVTPSTRETVTVALPARTDCAAAGAVCTGDGRGIEVSVSAEVPGPDTGLDPAPRVTGASVTNGPGPNGAWDAGETVRAEVRFNAAVTVHGPPGVGPQLAILLDGARREATYLDGAGTQTLTFAYPVVAADAGAHTAWVAPNGLTLNGVTLGDTRGREATIGFSMLSVSDAAGREGSDEALAFTVTLAPPVTAQVTVDYATAAGTATAGTDYTETTGTLTFAAGETAKTVSVPLIDDTVEDSGETFTLTLSHATGALLGDAEATGTILNTEAAIPALTAAFREVPATHDGSTAFSFELAFTEEPQSGFRRATLRDSTLEVAGAAVTSVRRLKKGKNKAWAVTVTPSLAIVLDGERREAAYTGGAGTQTLTFAYPVVAADAGARRAWMAANGLILNGVVLRDNLEREAETDFGAVPYVTAVELVADASGDDIWTPGETIEAQLTFSEAVTVAGGAPTLKVTVAGKVTTLDYASGSGSTVLVFSRAVTDSSGTRSRIAVTANSLALGGARIVSTASGRAAAPGHDGTEATTATAALTAAFRHVPPEHDGSALTLELAFSEEPGRGLNAETLRESALSATGGQVTEVSRLQEGSNRRWRLTVAPDGAGAVSVTLAATADCAAEGAICTDDERPLAAAVTATVKAQLTVAFERVPAEHDGTGPIFFSFAFSEEPGTVTYQSMRTESLVMHLGGERILWGSGERPEKPKKRRWRVGVSLPSSPTDAGKADLTVEIAPRDTCEDTGAVCTPDGRMLSHTLSAVIQGPPGVSVADAPAPEAGASTLDFTVTLSRAAAETVTVDYASADGSAPDGATAGEDYTAASGTLTFAPGETGKTVPVAVLDDADDGETVTLTLTNASGNHAWLADAQAAGTISNPDTAVRVAPYVTAVALAPDASGDRSWTVGETLEVRLTFSEVVTVAGGAPTLKVTAAGATATLDYVSGPSSAVLVFSRAVTGTDGSFSQIAVTADSLALNGASVVSAVSGLAAALGHDGTAATEPVLLRGRVALGAAFLDLPAEGHGGAAFTLKLQFSEEFPLSWQTPADSGIAVTNGTLSGLVRVTAGENREWTVTVTPDGSDDVTLTLPATTDCAAAKAICNADEVPLSAAVSVTVPATTGEQVTTLTLALTAAFLELPADGHGGAAFTLKLQFSEEFPLSWQTPADSGIAVTNGTLTGLVRVTAGENREWTVTVTPDGGDDVTLTLPATTDCAAAKAICNGDDVPLSAAVSVTVPATAQQTQEQAVTQPTLTGSTLWSSTLTVGEPDFFGFIGSGNGGSLSNAGWSEDGRRHTVGQVDLALYSDRANELWVEFSPAPGNLDDLTLHAGESVKALSAAVRTGNRFVWPVGELIWAAGEEVFLLLTRRVEVAPYVTAALTAAFLELPADGHAGSAFTLKLRFSEEFPLSYLTLRDSALSVTNGTLTGVARVSAGEDREWTVTVTPDGDAAVTVTLAAPADCAAANALCTGDNRPLSAALSVTVAGPEPGEPEEPAGEPLTVRFESIPAEHDGRSAVVFRLAFSEAPHQFGYRTLRDETLRIRQGEARPASKARRLDSSSNRRWEVTYQPVSNADITVALGPTLACGDDGAVCTENGRRLSNTVSTVIPGPPGLSVADAQVEEAAQATVDFTVILSRAAAETVTLEYATSDGTAVAGEDYTAASGTLSFSPGQTTQTVPVAVLDDPHDEGSETFTLVLSNPSGNHAWLSAARATGTISNSDPLPRGWLARFGRTSATQVLGLLDARFDEARAPASQLTLGILRD